MPPCVAWVDDGRPAAQRCASDDGSTIVGSNFGPLYGGQAVRWTSSGVEGLGFLAGFDKSYAYGVSDDGSTVVGYCTDADFNITAMIWQSGVGMTSLRDALLSRGVGLTGWDMLESALHISADGRFIVGNGVFNGESRGFVADLGMTVPAPGASGLLGLAAAVGEKPASLETHRIRAG